jgi:hypothetical protein
MSTPNQSLDRLDALADDGDELPSLMDILPRSRPVVQRVTSAMVDLTIDPSDDVSLSALTVFACGLRAPSPSPRLHSATCQTRAWKAVVEDRLQTVPDTKD